MTKYPRAAGAALYVNKAFGIRFLTFMRCAPAGRFSTEDLARVQSPPEC